MINGPPARRAYGSERLLLAGPHEEIKHIAGGLHLPKGRTTGKGYTEKKTSLCTTQNITYTIPSKHDYKKSRLYDVRQRYKEAQ